MITGTPELSGRLIRGWDDCPRLGVIESSVRVDNYLYDPD